MSSSVRAAALAAALLATPLSGVNVSWADTGTDASADTDFLFRLGMMEGHLIIGHELVAAGQPALALPHFGHPVRELYDDVADYVATKHVAPFNNDLIKLEAAVAAAPQAPETEALYRKTIATLHQARLATPETVRNSVPDIIKICADTIDTAAGEYSQAVEEGTVKSPVEYHDSRGYLTFVSQETEQLSRMHGDPASQSLIGRFRAVLAKAQYIVAPLIPAPEPRATPAEYRALAAQAVSIAASK